MLLGVIVFGFFSFSKQQSSPEKDIRLLAKIKLKKTVVDLSPVVATRTINFNHSFNIIKHHAYSRSNYFFFHYRLRTATPRQSPLTTQPHHSLCVRL